MILPGAAFGASESYAARISCCFLKSVVDGQRRTSLPKRVGLCCQDLVQGQRSPTVPRRNQTRLRNASRRLYHSALRPLHQGACSAPCFSYSGSRQARAVWFAWWSATFLFGGISRLRCSCCAASAPSFSIGVGVAALIAAFGCCWQGARAFDRRPPLWLPFLGRPACGWRLACCRASSKTPAIASCCPRSLLAPLMGMSAVEFWRGRHEPLPSRWAGHRPVRLARGGVRQPDPAGRRAAVSVRRAADAARLDRGVQSDRVLSHASCWPS